jgi:uracil-DNA glycosylase family 4
MKYPTIKHLHKYWAEKNTCKLKETATQAVFGEGSPSSEIIFIGEAPGKDEDISGKPFVGRAGKFLNELLESIKMERSDIYITNIVKYRPPGNRDPLPDEKQNCSMWLYEEINFINPKLIVFLGRHSMNNFFPEEKISIVHGKLLHKKFNAFKNEYFLALYHPASALYNGSMREVLLKDFSKINKILSKIKLS